jgi:hypothetical protein
LVVSEDSILLENWHWTSKSSFLTFAMASSKKDKHYPNSRARRHSGTVVVTHGKKSKRDKDTDSESLSSSSTEATVSEMKKCPLRFMMAGMLESDAVGERKGAECPLRRVQLWHTIPLCVLAIINLLLVIIALLGLAGYRIAMHTQVFLLRAFNVDLSHASYAESVTVPDDLSLSSGERG